METASVFVPGAPGWYEPLLDLLPTPLLLIEPDTARVIYANRAAHRLAGGTFPMDVPAEEYHRVYRCYDESGARIPDHQMPGVRAARGERFANMHMDWDTPDGRRSLIVSGTTIEPPSRPPVCVVTFEDITDVERARRQSEALSEVGALLAGSLDRDAILQQLAELAVPRLGDWCFVELLRPDGSMVRAAIATADPALLETVREFSERYPLDPDAPWGSAQVMRTGEPLLAPEIPDEALVAVAQDDEHLRILRALEFGSCLIVPLRSGGEVIGDLALANGASGRRYGPEDLVAAQELADRCGLYLENARLYEELRLARDELEAILAGVADAVTVQAADGRLRYVNDAAVRLLGEPLGLHDRESLLAADPRDLAAAWEILGEDGSPLPLEQLPGRRVLAGEEPEPVTVSYRLRGSREERWSRVKSRPLRDADGRVTHAINVVEDITDLKRAEERQRLLAEASRVLAGSLDYEATLQRVAWLAVPELADWCMFDLITEEGLRRVAVAHADPARAELAERFRGLLIDPAGTQGPAAVARTGRSELRPEVDAEHFVAAALNPVHHALVTAIGVRSAASVPMTVHGQRLGVLTLSTAESGRRLGAHQLAIAEELARRAAVAVDNARVHQQRSTIARTLQDSLLPPALPDVPGLESAALYRAAGAGTEVGGDFYDLFWVTEDEWIAVIGDVCGKGAEAAAVTALARYTIRTAAVRRRSPAAILSWVNDAMRRQELAGRFCTIACVHVDLSRPRIRVTAACGGHPPALLRRADGTVEELGPPGTLLGLVPDPTLRDQRSELGPHDALVLYTDGVTEARAPERVVSEAELEAALGSAACGHSAQQIVEHLAAIAVGKEGRPPRDDIAILALRARG